MHRKRKREKYKILYIYIYVDYIKVEDNRKKKEKKSIEKYKNFSQNHRQVSYFLKQSTKSPSRNLKAKFIYV